MRSRSRARFAVYGDRGIMSDSSSDCNSAGISGPRAGPTMGASETSSCAVATDAKFASSFDSAE